MNNYKVLASKCFVYTIIAAQHIRKPVCDLMNTDINISHRFPINRVVGLSVKLSFLTGYFSLMHLLE